MIAPEQKARTTYDNILRLADDPDVKEVIKFLREREVVHYQRFGEASRTDLSGFQIFHVILASPLSLMIILWIIIMATSFFLL